MASPARRAPLLASRRRLLTAVVPVVVAGLALSACSDTVDKNSADGGSSEGVSRLQIMAPADPGGGWDSTARAMSAALEGAQLAKSTTVTNVPGAGGTIGLAQLANEKSEDYLMVMGLVMIGAIETSQSPTTLDDVTPIARLTAED
jgi:putative tricarboxylic transport membrane protein